MRILLCLLMLLTMLQLPAQSPSNYSKKIIYESNKFTRVENSNLNSQQYLVIHHGDFGLGQDDELIAQKEIKDKSGFVRRKFFQEYKGIRVLGSTLTLHEKSSKVEKLTGRIFPKIDLNLNVKFTDLEVGEIAKNLLYEKLIVDFPHLEIDKALLKIDQIDQLIMDKKFPDYSGHYLLAYEVKLKSKSHLPIHEKMYIDANTGELVKSLTELCTHNVIGTAKTRYYGTQKIVTDSIEPGKYLLRDSTRGQGIFTLNGLITGNSDAGLYYEDFMDDDNYWNNANQNFDEIAGDAHYCTSSFYDLMNDNFGWSGLDGEGASMIANVHARGRYYTNAFWDGDATNFGNGDCNDNGPLTVLDIVGHEFTHGIIDYSADLIYENESGALNESIADIFGKALEYYYDAQNFNWIVGNKVKYDPNEGGFRYMDDPNGKNDPKYYQGDFWYTGNGDRGGVHTNSGVFNHWFYLLVEGGVGTNEKEEDFEVLPLGMEKALDIVFGMLTGYLTMDSDYVDAFKTSLLQSEDLYGTNSIEQQSVLEAWRAVGLFQGIDDFDLGLELVVEDYYGCPNESIQPSIIVRNLGVEMISVGTEINLAYSFSNGDLQQETTILMEDLEPLDSILYVFEKQIEFAGAEKDDLEYFLENEDNFLLNNISESDLEFFEQDGKDLVVTDFQIRIKDPCNPGKIGDYRVSLTNDGCIPIVDADSISLKVTTDLQEFTIPYKVFNPIKPGSSITSFRGFTGVDITPGFTNFTAELVFKGETILDNNQIEGKFANTFVWEGEYLLDFSDQTDYLEDISIVNSSSYALDSLVEYKGSTQLGIVAKGAKSNLDYCQSPEDFFNENRKTSTITACINTEGMEEPRFAFDLTFIKNGINIEGVNNDFKTMIQVSTDSTTFPLIYLNANDTRSNEKFELTNDYSGQLKIEILLLSGEKLSFDEGGVENTNLVLFDNLELFDQAERPDNFEGTYLVYPNPIQDEITIFSSDRSVNYTIEIFDLLGRLVYRQPHFGTANISVSHFSTGPYFYVIRSENLIKDKGKLFKVF